MHSFFFATVVIRCPFNFSVCLSHTIQQKTSVNCKHLWKMRFLRFSRPATYMPCKEIMLILAGGPAMMGSLVACIYPHMDAAIDDVRLLFISAPAVFQVNINNIKPELACQMRIPSAELVLYNRVLYGLKFICFNCAFGSCSSN